MNYYIGDVATVAGVSTRTIRYYDSIGLLKPSYTDSSGYRVYTDKEIDRLQEILILKRLKIPLQDIKSQLSATSKERLELLQKQKALVEQAILNHKTILETIETTIQHQKRGITMKNDKKFNGLKEQMIRDNDNKYGDELREKYGREEIESSYQKVRKMSKWEFQEAERIAKEILSLLASELPSNNPTSDGMQRLCALHQTWVKMYWTSYDETAHMSLVTMYTQDKRFQAYYDSVGKGATELLHRAMKHYLKKDN